MNLNAPVRAGLTAMAACVGISAAAQSSDGILQASLLPGWRQPDGTHVAAISITLAPGWKTYWRAPGDAGIPPVFDLSGSGNLASAQVIWPRPEVFSQNGMRSIGYHDAVVWPLQVTPSTQSGDIQLSAEIEIGVCKDICIPKTLKVSAVLPRSGGARDSRIAAALADRPYSGAEAGASNLRCQITPTADGVSLAVSVDMPALPGREAAVIETADPLLWVSEPSLSRTGQAVTVRAEISHVEGAPFALNRSKIRTTILGSKQAVELAGCTNR